MLVSHLVRVNSHSVAEDRLLDQEAIAQLGYYLLAFLVSMLTPAFPVQ
jgi:hypothetical protein